jgi:hypothetical protein
MPKLEDLFVYIDLLPVLVILLFIKKIKERPIWVIFVYCIYSFINNTLILNREIEKTSFTKLVYFFTLFEYLLFAFIIYLIIKNILAKKIIFYASLVFALICAYFIFWGNLKGLDSNQTSVECILIIIYCLYYFYEQLTSPDVEFIHTSYKFWVVIALLLYLSGSFFLFVYANDMPDQEAARYWPILYISGIIRNLLFAFAIYLSTRKSEDEEPYESQF